MNDGTVLDASLIWQSQSKEYSAMTLEDIQNKAAVAQARIRRNLILTFVIGVVVLALCAITIVTIPMTGLRMITAGVMFFVVLIARNAYVRLVSSENLPRRVAFDACLDYYRNELWLQYRAVYVRWRLLVPLVIFLWFSWKSFDAVHSYQVMRIVLPAVLVAVFLIRHVEIRKMRHELSALDDLRNINGN
jgi:hypothetical protein